MAWHKYKAKPTWIGTERFDSMGEAARYSELRLLEHQGLITELERQPRYTLHALGGEPICAYVADFAYFEDGLSVVEDFKGPITPLFRVKERWFRAEYGDRHELRVVRKN